MNRFAFDLGTNSIGWAVLDVSNPEFPEIAKDNRSDDDGIGVRIFPDGRVPKKGIPLNEARRTARQMRRQRERKIRRKKAMLSFLTANSLMPAEREERLAIARLDPYELRDAALKRRLEPFELARIMMHLSVRRGFKSNRLDKPSSETNRKKHKKEKVDKKAEENKGMLNGIDILKTDLQGLTLGQWLYYRKSTPRNSIRFRPNIEKHKALYSFYPSRKMYEDEFAAIREKQENYYGEINWDRLHWLIFFQRPLKRPERGRCQFYTDEARGYKAFPSAHRFRILQEIGNLKYENTQGIREEIPAELKKKLFDALDSQKSQTFDEIRKLFGENYTGPFNFEDAKRDKLKGNEISVDFRKGEYFGEIWDTLDIGKQDEIVEKLMIDDDENSIIDFLKTFGLTEEQARKLSGYNFSGGTTMLSSRFMIECSEIMLSNNLSYYDAQKKIEDALHNSKKGQQELQQFLPYYGKVLTSLVSRAGGESNHDNDGKKYGSIANPTVHIALNQLRKLVNALILQFGRPDEIFMEINRELKQSRARKDKIIQDQAQNQKDNVRIKAELAKLRAPDSGEYIKKYKLWEELVPGKKSGSRLCPYCGKPITAAELVSNNIEIDHILPYSRTLLNSRSNLTVAHKRCNQDKRNLSPYEAFHHNPGEYNWDDIFKRSREARFDSAKRRKFSSDAMTVFEKENRFLERQLTDTAYLAKAGKDYLSAILPANSIHVTPGRLTSMLRKFWNFNTLLNNGDDKWSKNRSDHRHHALDALVIGLCDRKLVAKAARINSHRGYKEIDAPECPLGKDREKEEWQEEIVAKLKAIVVSHKSDHGKEGKLYAETAMAKHPYLEKISPDELANEKEVKRIVPKAIQADVSSLVEKEGFKKAKVLLKTKYEYLRVFRDKWVSRKPLVSLSDRDIVNIADEDIRKKVQELLLLNPEQSKQDLQDVFAKLSNKTGIRSVRYFPKDQKPLEIKSCANKAYLPEDFYCVDIWKAPIAKGKYKFEGVFISRLEAMWKHLPEKRKEQDLRRHPAAKFVVRLFKNDIILLSNDKEREFCRVAGFSTTQNKVDIYPLYASNSIAAWKKNTNNHLASNFWSSGIEGHNFKSINVLFSEFEVKLVKITVDGRVIFRN